MNKYWEQGNESATYQALRMNPPISMTVPRTAAEDTELGNVFIPKGTKVIVDVRFQLRRYS